MAKRRTKVLVILSTVVFYSLCFCGCLWQLVSLSQIYFEFKTSTEVYVNIPMEIPNPALSICFRYNDIIDKKKALQNVRSKLRKRNQNLNRNQTWNRKQNLNRNVDWKNFLTIRDIFSQTPATKLLMKQCRFRQPHKYTYEDLNMEQCHRTFLVSKYYFLEYICYRFRMRENFEDLYDYLKISYSSELSGMLFEVSFNLSVFQSAEGMRLIVHSADNLPFMSMTMTPVIWRLYDSKRKVGHFNRFQMIYSTVEITSLPSPFSTNCEKRSQTVCKKNCVTNATIDAFGKFPFEFAIDWPVDRSHITNSDLKNKTLSDLLLQFKSKCDSLCHHVPCFVDYTMTRVTRLREKGRMKFRVSAPREPFTAIIHNPFLTTTNYIIGFSSVLGTWLGFSILKINPFKISFPSINWSFMKRRESEVIKVCNYCVSTRKHLLQQLVFRSRLERN